eukprot:SAG11_NODE_899_length_6643_cov_55.347048_5_plen_92_part_00
MHTALKGEHVALLTCGSDFVQVGQAQKMSSIAADLYYAKFTKYIYWVGLNSSFSRFFFFDFWDRSDPKVPVPITKLWYPKRNWVEIFFYAL